MVTNISIMGSGVRVSVGQYNHITKVITLWVYATREDRSDGKLVASIPEFDISPYPDVEKVRIEDLDWGYRYEITLADFKRRRIKDGVRKIDLNKLTKM